MRTLTPDGERLLQPARDTVHAAQAFEDAIDDGEGGVSAASSTKPVDSSWLSRSLRRPNTPDRTIEIVTCENAGLELEVFGAAGRRRPARRRLTDRGSGRTAASGSLTAGG